MKKSTVKRAKGIGGGRKIQTSKEPQGQQN